MNEVFSPRVEIVLEWLSNRRFYVYLFIFAVGNLFDAYRQYMDAKYAAIQMEILEKSFSLDDNRMLKSLGLDDEEGDQIAINLDSKLL